MPTHRRTATRTFIRLRWTSPALPLPAENQPAFCETVPSDLTFDVIWSNPPIRVGKEALHTLLMAWLPKLKVGGAAYLVVQKNLGSDSLTPLAGRCARRGVHCEQIRELQGLPYH